MSIPLQISYDGRSIVITDTKDLGRPYQPDQFLFMNLNRDAKINYLLRALEETRGDFAEADFFNLAGRLALEGDEAREVLPEVRQRLREGVKGVIAKEDAQTFDFSAETTSPLKYVNFFERNDNVLISKEVDEKTGGITYEVRHTNYVNTQDPDLNFNQALVAHTDTQVLTEEESIQIDALNLRIERRGDEVVVLNQSSTSDIDYSLSYQRTAAEPYQARWFEDKVEEKPLDEDVVAGIMAAQTLARLLDLVYNQIIDPALKPQVRDFIESVAKDYPWEKRLLLEDLDIIVEGHESQYRFEEASQRLLEIYIFPFSRFQLYLRLALPSPGSNLEILLANFSKGHDIQAR